jgi:hypothetical protein
MDGAGAPQWASRCRCHATPQSREPSTPTAKVVTKPLFRMGLAWCVALRLYSAFLAQR